MSAIKKSFARGAFWSFIGQNVSNVASFLIFVILARLLGPFDFGIVAFATVFVDFGRIIALAGLPTALIRAPEWDEDDASTVFWANTAFSIALAIIVGVGVGYLLGRFYSRELQWVLLALSICLVVDALRATHEAKLQRDFQFKSLATRTAVATAGAGIVGVVLAFAGFGVWALVINRIASSAIQTAIVWGATTWVPRPIFRRDGFIEMLTFGMHVGATTVMGMVNRHVPALVAGFLIGPVAVGLFRIASRLASLLLDLTTDSASQDCTRQLFKAERHSCSGASLQDRYQTDRLRVFSHVFWGRRRRRGSCRRSVRGKMVRQRVYFVHACTHRGGGVPRTLSCSRFLRPRD